MRILMHDYGGYPFPLELSKMLADKGNEVTHLYSASFHGPKGLLVTAEIADSVKVQAIELGSSMDRWNYLQRRSQEIQHGQQVADYIKKWRPHVVISANTPIEGQKRIFTASKKINCRFIFWLQDIYSVAVEKILAKKMIFLGKTVGSVYRRIEKNILMQSDAIVAITEDFRSTIGHWGVPVEKISIVENWTPLGNIPLFPKNNSWTIKMGLSEKIRFLYSGTLSMKHNPDLLLQLAIHFQQNQDVEIVVISEGRGPDWLKAESEK